MASGAGRSLRVGGETVPPGEVRYVEIPVARLPVGSWMSLPVAAVNGRRDGPRIWLDAAIHGDELNGIEIVRRLLRAVDPAGLSGAIIAVPIVNVFGLINQSRYLPDRRDLNRSFPGSKRGSLAARLAHLFLTEIVEVCDAGIDFHTGSGNRTNLPQIRGDLDDPVVRRYARHFAPPAIIHSKVRGGSLRGAATDRGKPILVFEGGEALRLDEDVIQTGVRGTLRLLGHLRMIPRPPRADRTPHVSRKTRWCRAPRSGLCHFAATLGEQVGKGDEIGAVTDTFGLKSVPIVARETGLVIAISTAPFVNRGDALVHIATRASG